MFDSVDSAIFHPTNGHAYFFKGGNYIKYAPDNGVVATAGGSTLRTIGTTGWTSFPSSFRKNLDASCSYSNGFLYFFKGSRYIKYKPGDGVVKTSSGKTIRTIGVTGWKSLPPSFRSDLSAAFYYPHNNHAYFFKNDKYVKYKPGTGVVKTKSGKAIRTVGTTGWKTLPTAFRNELDAVFHYPPTRRTYFFTGRDYARWNPGVGLDDRYPRRIGYWHRKNGGWPGLSSLVAMPCTVSLSDTTASIWVWTAIPTDQLAVKVNGRYLRSPTFVEPPLGTAAASIRSSVNSIVGGSEIRLLKLAGLRRKHAYTVRIVRADRWEVLETLRFTTAPKSCDTGAARFVLGSCADTTKKPDVANFSRIAAEDPDFAVLCGDNCYYYSNNLQSTGGASDGDWRSVRRMLTRQLEARNHPQFVKMLRTVPVFSTWDDHDCGYNNVKGRVNQHPWVKRIKAAGVYRALWSHRYRNVTDLYYEFHWGPMHFFVTDGRYFKTSGADLLGSGQLTTLQSSLSASEAPLKVLVFSNVALHTGHNEGLASEAPGQQQSLLQTLRNDVSGRVLVLSGDVHMSECNFDGGDANDVKTLEVTSSPLRVKKIKGSTCSKTRPGLVWMTRAESFALIDVNIQSVRGGSITAGSISIQITDAAGNVPDSEGNIAGNCVSTWNLATGQLT